MIKKEAEAFIKEYEVLCKKYNLMVGACGCCQSPWVKDWEEEDEFTANPIKHLNEQLEEFLKE